MAILSHSLTKAGFELAHTDWASSSSSVYNTVAFIDDGYLYTHGKYFRIFADATNIFTSNRSNNTVTINDANGKTLTSFDIGIYSVTNNTSPITATSSSGSVVISHNTSSLVASTLGATATSSDSIVVPKIVTDDYGHLITGTTQYTATLNRVRSTSISNNSNYYLTFTDQTSDQTSELLKTSGVYINPYTNAIYASVVYQGGSNLASLYAPINHASSSNTYGVGDSSNYGHLRLSDSTSSQSDTTGGYAATPKAIYDSLTAAKAYADTLASANDAMLFKGSINADGTITSGDSNINGKTLSQLTSYSAGWTFRTSTALTIIDIGVLESGDLVICIKDYTTAYSASDWTVTQANIDGAVTTNTTLTASQLLIGGGNRIASVLAAGTNGSVLKIVSGVPTWSIDTDTWRAIKVNGTEQLSSTINTALDITSGSGISVAYTGGQVVIANTGVISSDVKTLTLSNSGTSVGTYNPVSAERTLNVTGGLVMSFADPIFTIQHSNSVSAQGSSAVRSFTYDANGHITGSSVVTSLQNPNALTFYANDGTTSLASYDGSSERSFRFVNGTDISISPSFAGSQMTYSLSMVQRYRAINYYPTYAGVSTAIYNDTTSTALTLKPGNTNISLNYTGGNLEISSINTWRDIQSASVANSTGVLTASTSIGTASLKFGDDFAIDSEGAGDVNIAWAEIDGSGNITYHT